MRRRDVIVEFIRCASIGKAVAAGGHTARSSRRRYERDDDEGILPVHWVHIKASFVLY